MFIPYTLEETTLIVTDRRHQADTERLLKQAPRRPLRHARPLLATWLLQISRLTFHTAVRIDPSAHTFHGANGAQG